jgi:hypothetical protein
MPTDPLHDPDLAGHLEAVGWRPGTVPLLIDLLREIATDRVITWDDLTQVRREAVRMWHDPSARLRVRPSDWHGFVAAAVVRYAWWTRAA